MSTADRHYRILLDEEFGLRRKRNPAYSLRAFARDLEMPPSKLSEILRGISGLSGKTATRIAQNLALSEEDIRWFISSVEASHSRSKSGKLRAQQKLETLGQGTFDEISLDRFRIISDWYHFALLELTETSDFKSDEKWIAHRLGITLSETKDAIRRLCDAGLLRKSGGKWKQTHADLATPSGIPSREIRKHHSQILGKAQQALDRNSVDERDFSAMTMVISEKQLTEAKRLIKDFRRQFDLLMKAHAPPKDRVYALAVQFFPLDQKGKNT